MVQFLFVNYYDYMRNILLQHVEGAEKCLSAGTELRLRGQIIEAHKALHRKEIEDKKNLKEKRIKDSRNLYLIKEGGNGSDYKMLSCLVSHF